MQFVNVAAFVLDAFAFTAESRVGMHVAWVRSRGGRQPERRVLRTKGALMRDLRRWTSAISAIADPCAKPCPTTSPSPPVPLIGMPGHC